MYLLDENLCPAHIIQSVNNSTTWHKRRARAHRVSSTTKTNIVPKCCLFEIVNAIFLFISQNIRTFSFNREFFFFFRFGCCCRCCCCCCSSLSSFFLLNLMPLLNYSSVTSASSLFPRVALCTTVPVILAVVFVVAISFQCVFFFCSFSFVPFFRSTASHWRFNSELSEEMKMRFYAFK